MLAVVDTGPLYAVTDLDDADHDRCQKVLQDRRHRLVVPAMVVAEVSYLVGSRLGSKMEARFLRGMQTLDIEAPSQSDWRRIAELIERYADFRIGGTGASIVALAERLGADTVITLDVPNFRPVQPRHRTAFRMLP